MPVRENIEEALRKHYWREMIRPKVPPVEYRIHKLAMYRVIHSGIHVSIIDGQHFELFPPLEREEEKSDCI